MLKISKKIIASELFKFFLGIILMLVTSTLLAFNALILWVATGERSFEALTPYIESALSATDGSYEVKISKTRLIWDGWKQPVDIRLDNVSVLTREGKKFTSFPEIALGIDVLYLPLGRIMPTSLSINNPRMNLMQYDDMSFGFSFNKEESSEISPETTEQTVPFATMLAPLLSNHDNSNYRRLRTVNINNASLRVQNKKHGVFFDAQDFNLTLARNRRAEIKIKTTANIFYKDNISTQISNTIIRSEFSLKPNQPIIDGYIEFSELHPDILAGLFSENPAHRSFTLPISGKTSFSLSPSGDLQSFEFYIKGNKGVIKSDYLTNPLEIHSLTVAGAIGNNMSEIRLDNLEADINGIKLHTYGRGRMFDTTTDASASPEIVANINVKDIPAERIKNLWPESLSPMTREWVTENITEGMVTESNITLNIKKGDLKLPILPRESINATLNVDDLKIRYLPEHPSLSKAKGRIHIDGISLAADIESADFLEKTKLSKGMVTIDDLNIDNPYINVALYAESPAKDMVNFLGLPRLNHAEHLALNSETVSGNVTGEAKIGFNFFAPEGKTAEEAITYDIKAQIENITQKNFLKKFDITGANGNINVNNTGLEFIGNGEVNGAKVSHGNVKYLFTPDNGIDTIMEITATCSVQNLKRFGYPEFPFLKGNIATKATVKLGKNIEQNEATLNLTDSEVNFNKIISWKKPLAEEAKLELTTEKKEDTLKINTFHINGEKISGKGSASLSKDMSNFTTIKLTNLKMGDNDISNLDYQLTENGTISMNVSGASVNISDHMNSHSDGFSFQNFPAIQLKTNIEKLTLGDNRFIEQLKGEFACNKSICTNADLTGKTGENKDFSIKITSNAKKQRQLDIKSDDAGSFLRSAAVLDGMSGGNLTINGIYLDNGTLKGNLNVSEHSIKNAPLLGKILSMASLTGFIDTLQGNGITFKNMSIPFAIKQDVITIEKAKTYGSSIGITLDGTITFPYKTLNIEGTVVPSYSLNNFFGKVPLLGEILAGGEDGGVFAARYNIKGPSDKAEVSVNPLSILTPGFLRGLFDIFDEAPPEKPSDKSKTKSRKYEYPK